MFFILKDIRIEVKFEISLIKLYDLLKQKIFRNNYLEAFEAVTPLTLMNAMPTVLGARDAKCLGRSRSRLKELSPLHLPRK